MSNVNIKFPNKNTRSTFIGPTNIHFLQYNYYLATIVKLL